MNNNLLLLFSFLKLPQKKGWNGREGRNEWTEMREDEKKDGIGVQIEKEKGSEREEGLKQPEAYK